MATPPLLGSFDPTTDAHWRDKVTADLKGADFDRKLVSRTLEGIEIQPLYGPAEGQADASARGLAGRTEAGRWRMQQTYGLADPATVGEAIQADLARGLEGVWLRFDRGLCRAGVLSGSGLAISTVDHLDHALSAVDLAATPVALEAPGAGLGAAALLIALARRRGVALEALRGELGLDPLTALARDGLRGSTEAHGEVMGAWARWAHEHAPGLTTARASTTAYAAAGATVTQQLGWGLASAVQHLRWLMAAGLSVSEAAGQITFEVAIGRDLFIEMARLRALRRCWARILEASGARAVPARIHARTGVYTLSLLDLRVNMLRATGEAFSAVVGGADSLSVTPFDDHPEAGQSEGGRRHALHVQHLLRAEAHLDQVADPAGGSGYVEHLTDEVARAGWSIFQGVEGAGGIVRALETGRIAAATRDAFSARNKQLATRRMPIVGASAFPKLDERLPAERPAPASLPEKTAITLEHVAPADLIQAAATGDLRALLEAALPATVAGSPPLDATREAAVFELFRMRSDARLTEAGARPSAFLASMGPLAHHKPRTDFTTQLMAVCGVEAVVHEAGFESAQAAAEAFDQAGTAVACICGRDTAYIEHVPGVTAALKAAGATTVLVAGRPGEHEAAWAEAGVDGYVHLGVDTLSLWNTLYGQTEEGAR